MLFCHVNFKIKMDKRVTNKYISVLERWLMEDQASVSKDNFSVYRHLDFFSKVTNRKRWIFDSFIIHKVIKTYLMEHHRDVNVMLAFELTPATIKGMIPRRLKNDNLKKVMTSPSVYIFRGDRKMVLCDDCIYLKEMSTYYDMDVYYHEYLDKRDDLIYRTIYMI